MRYHAERGNESVLPLQPGSELCRGEREVSSLVQILLASSTGIDPPKSIGMHSKIELGCGVFLVRMQACQHPSFGETS